ncbi:MAG: hypothetical protein ABIO40_02200 [Devosia sp.]
MLDKYLLCRPRGGLNDTLCQIEKCWKYAELHNRTLIIDTSRSGIMLQYSAFFAPFDGGQVLDIDASRLADSDLNAMECYPPTIRGRINSYRTSRSVSRRLRDIDSKAELSFDFSLDHREQLLVHEQAGGGHLSFDFLRRVRFADDIATDIRHALKSLGASDAAIHLRNTDAKTSVRSILKKVKRELLGLRVLICTDDAATISIARETLNASQIVTASTIVRADGKPLHFRQAYSNDDQRRQATLNSLTDLCALASADRLYIAQLSRGNYSGFAELAAFLAQNRDVLDRLLGRQDGANARPPGIVVRIESSPFLAFILRRTRRILSRLRRVHFRRFRK